MSPQSYIARSILLLFENHLALTRNAMWRTLVNCTLHTWELPSCVMADVTGRALTHLLVQDRKSLP